MDDETYGEADYSEQDVGSFGRQRARRIKVTYPKPDHTPKPDDDPPEPPPEVPSAPEPKPDDDTKSPGDRVKDLEKAIKGFRIESAGDGILRGGFGRLPDNPAKDLLDRMNDLSKAMDQFNLTGDGLQVSGSFDKGYSVSRENPCEQQQVNENPT